MSSYRSFSPNNQILYKSTPRFSPVNCSTPRHRLLEVYNLRVSLSSDPRTKIFQLFAPINAVVSHFNSLNAYFQDSRKPDEWSKYPVYELDLRLSFNRIIIVNDDQQDVTI